jgi:hypothetical protein
MKHLILALSMMICHVVCFLSSTTEQRPSTMDDDLSASAEKEFLDARIMIRSFLPPESRLQELPIKLLKKSTVFS